MFPARVTSTASHMEADVHEFSMLLEGFDATHAGVQALDAIDARARGLTRVCNRTRKHECT